MKTAIPGAKANVPNATIKATSTNRVAVGLAGTIETIKTSNCEAAIA